jgi:hypothetical protein
LNDHPDIAPVVESFARNVNDFYGPQTQRDEARTKGLFWFLDVELETELPELSLRRAYACINWAVSDCAEALDLRRISHSLWGLPLIYDCATSREALSVVAALQHEFDLRWATRDPLLPQACVRSVEYLLKALQAVQVDADRWYGVPEVPAFTIEMLHWASSLTHAERYRCTCATDVLVPRLKALLQIL